MKAPSHITLTEAMTEIAEGLGQSSEDYITAHNAKELERDALLLESARARAGALFKAGFDPDAFRMFDPNALITGYIPEVAAHRILRDAQKLERDEESKRLWLAGREIVSAGASGELTLKGRAKGDGKLEVIDAAELRYLAFNEQTGFDILYNRNTELFWTHVTLDKQEFAAWALRTETLSSKPTALSEKQATAFLTRCLKANDRLTKPQALNAVKDKGIPISEASFLRIWPIARVEAGLPAKASAGRPKTVKT